MNRIIYLNAIEPAPLSLRHPLGIDLDLKVTFRSQKNAAVDPTPLYPQFVLLPRSRGGTWPYDMTVYDAANGIARVAVPGSALVDRNGYGIELYTRRANPVSGDPPLPVGLAARGTLATQGAAYTSYGPLGMINIPVVTGPPGPQGAPGVGIQGEAGTPGKRGSQWTTGIGAPSTPPPLDTLAGDMYLDEASGDVWQYNGLDWVRSAP